MICSIKNVDGVLASGVLNSVDEDFVKKEFVEELAQELVLSSVVTTLPISSISELSPSFVEGFIQKYADTMMNFIDTYQDESDEVETVKVKINNTEYYIPGDIYEYVNLKDSDIYNIESDVINIPGFKEGASKLLIDAVNEALSDRVRYDVSTAVNEEQNADILEASTDEDNPDNDISADNSDGEAYVEELKSQADKKAKNGTLDKINFTSVYFKDNENLYEERFTPYVKSMFNTTILGMNDKSHRDMSSDAERTLRSILYNIAIKYKLVDGSEEYTIESLRNIIITDLAERVSNIVDGKDLTELTNMERVIYFDYITAREFYSVINNEVNFISSSTKTVDSIKKDGTYTKKKVVSFEVTKEVDGFRTNYDSVKEDKNSAFIKSVVESFPRTIPIDKNNISEDDLLSIIEWSKEDLNAHQRKEETVYATVKRVLSAQFVIDPSNPHINYRQYKAISSNPEFIAIRHSESGVITYLKNSFDADAVSLYNALYNMDEMAIYDPLKIYSEKSTGVSMQYSLKSIVDAGRLKVKNISDEEAVFTNTKPRVNTKAVLSAINTSLSSADKKSIINKGSIMNVGNTEINSIVANELMQQVEDTVNDGLSSELNSAVTVTLGRPNTSTLIDKKTVNDADINDSNIVYVNVKIDEEETISIPLVTSFNNEGLIKEQPNPNTSYSVVSVFRPNEISNEDKLFVGSKGNVSINNKLGKKILKKLGFPDEISKTVIQAINSQKNTNKVASINVHDFTNFVANYAVMIALNSDVQISNNVLNELGILDTSSDKPNSIIQLSENTKPISDLRYDIYSYLWPYRLSIEKKQEKIKGVGKATLSIAPGKQVASITPAGNANLNKIRAEILNEGSETRHASNDFVAGRVNVKEAIKKGEYNVATSKVDSQDSLTRGVKTRQLIEGNFLGAIHSTKDKILQEATVQLIANESSLIPNYNVSKVKGYSFIPIKRNNNDEKAFSLDKAKLDKELIDKQRNNYKDIINTIRRAYSDTFNIFIDGDINDLAVKNILDRYAIVHPEIDVIDAHRTIRAFAMELESIPSNTFYLHNINKVLKKYSFDSAFLKLVPNITSGLFFDEKTSSINTQLLADADLWLDQMSNVNDTFKATGEKDEYTVEYKEFYTPKDYIEYTTKKFLENIYKEANVTKLSQEAKNKFAELLGQDITYDKSTNKKVKNIIYTAYHYQEMMLNVDLGNVLFGDIYSFMKNPSVASDVANEKVNKFFVSKLQNDGNARQGLYKRAKPVTQTGGDVVTASEGGMSEDIHVAVYEDPEVLVNSLGSTKEGLTETFDGVYFKFSFASYMNDKATGGSKYGYNQLANVVKDIIINRNSITGAVDMDKRASHNMFNKNVLDFNVNDVERRHNDNLPFNTDGSPKKILVPNVIQEVINGKLIYKADYSKILELEAVTINDIFDYLGGSANPNLYDVTSEIMTLEQNGIKGKYFDGVSFITSRKMGAEVINPSSSFSDFSKKIFPSTISVSGQRTILDGTENPTETHRVALPSQILSASFAAFGTESEGKEIFQALGSLYELDFHVLNDKLLLTLFADISKGKKGFMPLVEKLESRDDTFAILVDLAKDPNYRTLVKDLFHSYVVGIMQDNVAKKSQDESLKAMLENKGDINGQLNSLFISIINTHIGDSLKIESDGMNNLASQGENIRKLYGEGVSKRYFMLENSSMDYTNANLNSKDLKAFNTSEIIFTDENNTLEAFGIPSEPYVVLNTIEEIRNHKDKNNNDSFPGKAKAIITDVALAKYADIIISDDSNKIGIIKESRNELFLKEIPILSVYNVDKKITAMTNVMVANGSIVEVCN